ncbi:MAG: hypothetical protein WCJ56_07440 [bacterium]
MSNIYASVKTLSVLLLVIVGHLTFSSPSHAAGFAYGPGVTPQLQVSNQLAVVNLTETSADVTMFISLEGIPEGEEISYVLPFWGKPEGFSLVEDDVENFRKTYVHPAYKQVMKVKRLINHRQADSFLQNSYLLTPASFVSLSYRQDDYSAFDGEIRTYSFDNTAHSRVELYSLGDGELHQLIKNSGLSEKEIMSLQQYQTPYFAVVHLRGISKDEKSIYYVSSKGVRYHFTHQLQGGRYVYPLGTGVAWTLPVMLTEIYFTCPPALVMNVNAPIAGENVYWYNYRHQADMVQSEATFADEADKAEITAGKSTLTSSLLYGRNADISAWQISYLQSNPTADIMVQLTPRKWPWRLAVADQLQRPMVPYIYYAVLALIAWLLTALLLIRRVWRRAGSPGNLLRHVWHIVLDTIVLSLIALVVGVLLSLLFPNYLMLGVSAITTILVFGIYFWNENRVNLKDDWRRWLLAKSLALYLALYLAMVFLLTGCLRWLEIL